MESARHRAVIDFINSILTGTFDIEVEDLLGIQSDEKDPFPVDYMALEPVPDLASKES